MTVFIETWNGSREELEELLLTLLRTSKGEVDLNINQKRHTILAGQSLIKIIDDIMTN